MPPSSKEASFDGGGGGGVVEEPADGEVAAADVEIREVWAHNLEAEFAVIRDIVDDFPFIAMDTEFPGVALRRVGTATARCRTQGELHYEDLRSNVDLLHLIQIGLAFSNASGRCPYVWQFNFREFDPESDVHNPGSIELLNKSGIDFQRHRAYGIDAACFAELLMSSGAVLNPDVAWITFHGGYDLGYLLKILTFRQMPDTVDGFLELTRLFFPKHYDVKHLIRFCSKISLWGGLDMVSNLLKIKRVGIAHQAGSDALITLRCHFAIVRWDLGDNVDKYSGVLFGINDHLAKLPANKKT